MPSPTCVNEFLLLKFVFTGEWLGQEGVAVGECDMKFPGMSAEVGVGAWRRGHISSGFPLFFLGSGDRAFKQLVVL